ncbi:MAG TPA: hypothetical protein HPP77_06595 [Candidatus Hydrogenedentes bacterium]|nr:hypothetical protein [Candidatus Hydrogenedentota bacterium]
MKRTDIAYLAAVALFALVFGLTSLSRAGRALTAIEMADVPRAGVAGQARDLDEGQIRRLIRQRRLSDHEAEFYKPVPAGPNPPKEPPSTSRHSADSP